MRPVHDPERLHASWPPRALVALWAAVLAGPILLLLSQETKYALVGWACRSGHELIMHLLAAATLVLVLLAMLVSAHRWRSSGGSKPTDGGDVETRDRFLASVGLMLGALSALVVFAQWLPDLFLSPCHLP